MVVKVIAEAVLVDRLVCVCAFIPSPEREGSTICMGDHRGAKQS